MKSLFSGEVWSVMGSLFSTSVVGGPFSQMNRVFKRLTQTQFLQAFVHLTVFLDDIISATIYPPVFSRLHGLYGFGNIQSNSQKL